jgi:tetratricopeptide (TPR) repeat protein
MSGDDSPTSDAKPARRSSPAIVQDPDFGPRFRVLSAIGKGGMGTVYRAYDAELKVEVALKVVNGVEEASLARFRREIALARKVTSPNVLRVYDLAEHEGLRFLSMEFVDGQDLGALMKHDGRIPMERAIAIFKQVCRGLAAAHAEGVIHRDLKPQNVLIDGEDHVRVGDFGLARSIGDSGLTASGAVLGSPAYMSPEQVRGDPLDERSDIYSLGIMLYQLVTGETPFRAATSHALMEMRLHKRAPLLRDMVPEAPANLEGVCAKCLALSPSARYRSVSEVLAALDSAEPVAASRARRWLVPAIVCGVVVVSATSAVIAWQFSRASDAPAAPERPALPPAAVAPPTPTDPADLVIDVLVLGTENRTPDSVFDKTIDALVTHALRRSTLVDPIAGPDLRSLADELGHEIAIDDQLGARLAARDHRRVVTVRMTVAPRPGGAAITLVGMDAGAGKTVYEHTLEATSQDDVVPAVGRLASGLREALGERISPDEADQCGLSLNLAADHDFALGDAEETIGKPKDAANYLRQAIAKDPEFAVAHSILEASYSNLGRPDEAWEQARIALAHVAKMGERDRLRFLAGYHSFGSGDYDRAIAAYQQLLAKWPRDAIAESNIMMAYLGRGEAKKALAAIETAAKHHPFDVVIRMNLPEVELIAGEFERAKRDLEQEAKRLVNPLPTLLSYLALAQALTDHRDAAIATQAKLEAVDRSWATISRADHALAEGRLAEAVMLLEKAIADDAAHGDADQTESKLVLLAEAKLRRGDRAGALAAAARVVKQPPRVLAAAFLQLAAGEDKRPAATAKVLAKEVTPSARSLGKLIEGELLRVHGKPEEAIVVVQEGVRLSDTAFAHFVLARAALDSKRFAEAYAEIQTCLARRGELAVSTDDIPSLRAIPPLTYYLARIQQGMGSRDATASYQAFLAMMHDPDPADPLVADARKRLQH